MKVQATHIKYIGIRTEPVLHQKFKEVARANHRSIEGEIKALMETRVREATKEAS